jgi:hypothetical protein
MAKVRQGWHPDFAPSYTPMEMLDKGVMLDCHYFNKVKGVPKKYSDHPKVNQPDDIPDPSRNYYGVKSRSSLKEWQEKGWILPNSPDQAGWIEWYIKYFEGRRLDEEDDRQVKRWKSFVARHQGQINANCKIKDKQCRPVQRQGLLQWAWDSTTEFTDKQREKNINRIVKEAKTFIETVSQESLPMWLDW